MNKRHFMLMRDKKENLVPDHHYALVDKAAKRALPGNDVPQNGTPAEPAQGKARRPVLLRRAVYPQPRTETRRPNMPANAANPAPVEPKSSKTEMPATGAHTSDSAASTQVVPGSVEVIPAERPSQAPPAKPVVIVEATATPVEPEQKEKAVRPPKHYTLVPAENRAVEKLSLPSRDGSAESMQNHAARPSVLLRRAARPPISGAEPLIIPGASDGRSASVAPPAPAATPEQPRSDPGEDVPAEGVSASLLPDAIQPSTPAEAAQEMAQEKGQEDKQAETAPDSVQVDAGATIVEPQLAVQDVVAETAQPEAAQPAAASPESIQSERVGLSPLKTQPLVAVPLPAQPASVEPGQPAQPVAEEPVSPGKAPVVDPAPEASAPVAPAPSAPPKPARPEPDSEPAMQKVRVEYNEGPRSSRNDRPAAKNGALIRLNNVVKAYQTPVGQFMALRGINLTINRGEFVAVVGKSGSGKSTLINMITGIDRPTSGEIYVGDDAIHNLSEGEMAVWRGRNIGIIFQFFQLLPMLSCVENVMLPMDFGNVFKPSEREARALHLLELVDMAEHAYKLPSEVSGGQQQRVAIARALANDPPLLVADEPTGNLDSKTADAVFMLFDSLVQRGKTILMVTHDEELARRVTRTITIADGEVVSEQHH